MATAQQIEANRRNAQLSTGPQSEADKATASRNSTSHGLSAAHILLPGEDAAAFNQLLANLAAEHAAQGETESFLVRQLAQSQWKLDRFDAIEAAIYHFILEGTGENSAYTRIAAIFMGKSTPDASMDRLERYRGTTRRAYHQSIKELRACQSDRQKREIAENKTNPIAAAPASPPPENRTNPIPQTPKPLDTKAPAGAGSNGGARDGGPVPIRPRAAAA